MWKLIPEKKMPPTRMVRYCCQILKETGCNNRYIATGVRWAESTKRKERTQFEKLGKTKKDKVSFSDEVMLMNDNDEKRRMSELCMQKNKMVVNPIIDWSDSDIWEYIRSEKLRVCELYNMGYNRVGCIGCPMAGKNRWKEFADFPEYKKLYIHAFDRLAKINPKHSGQTGEQVFRRWMEDENVEGQMELSEFMDY